MVSSAYLKLLIFLLAILIPACASSSPAFHMMYSAYKSSKQGDSIQPWHTPFPIWNQSVVLCPVVTCFLTRIQISQEAGKVFWYSHLWEFPTVPQREREIDFKEFAHNSGCLTSFYKQFSLHHDFSPLSQQSWHSWLSTAVTLHWGSGVLITRYLVLLCTSPETKWQIGGRCMWCNF